MSLIFQRQVTRTTPSDIRTNYKETSSITSSSMYKTEVDLGIVRPHTQHSFRSAHKDSNPALPCEKPPGVCLISPTDSAVDAVVSGASDPVEERDSEVKVETKSIGKISDLITRFNDVESGVVESKIPVKKFRIDLENVHKRDVFAREKASASLSDQGDEVLSLLGSETRCLPVVEMNFKLPKETSNPKEATVDTNISTRHKQLCLLRIPPKPSPKPKIMKNLSHQEGVVYLQNTSETTRIRSSELRCVFPSASNEFHRRDHRRTISCTGEYENGRKTFVPAAVSASPSNENEHNLIHFQNTETAGSTDLLPKGNSQACKIHNEYESLSTEDPQEKALKPATDSMKEKQRKATVIKPSVLPRYVGIHKHKQAGINWTMATEDVIPASVETLDATNISCNTLSKVVGGKLTTSGRSSWSSDRGGVVRTTEEPGDLIANNKSGDAVASTETGNMTVKNKIQHSAIINNAGSITGLRVSRNANMARNHTRMFVSLVNSTLAEPSVGCRSSHMDSNVNGSTTSTESSVDCCSSSTEPGVTGYSTSTEPGVSGCSTSTESGVTGCSTSTESGVTGCSTSTEPGVTGCSTSTEPGVTGCSTSTESSVDCSSIPTESSSRGCTTSTESGVTECSTSTDPGVTGCSTSTEQGVTGCSASTSPGVTECSTSTDPGVTGCSTSTEQGVTGCSTSTESSVDCCSTSTESSSRGCATSTKSTVIGCPTSADPSVGGCPTFTDPSVGGCPTFTDPSVGGCPTFSDPSVGGCRQRNRNNGSDTISVKLDMLKSELMAMRKMDLVLLRQLINISQAIQRIQRFDLPKISRSLTILSSRKTPQPRHKPVERQNSAPHCADRRRYLFSSVRWKTDEDNRDSLSSFDESEFDSQSELEESSSSLNSNTTSVSRSFDCPRILFQSCTIPLSLDISEEADQNYEDILQRNVRLWKMSFQRHQSLQEKLDVWF